MYSLSNMLGGGGMIVLALWWYYRYSRLSMNTSEDMWRASRTMSVVAIGMFLWVSLLIWGLK